MKTPRTSPQDRRSVGTGLRLIVAALGVAAIASTSAALLLVSPSVALPTQANACPSAIIDPGEDPTSEQVSDEASGDSVIADSLDETAVPVSPTEGDASDGPGSDATEDCADGAQPGEDSCATSTASQDDASSGSVPTAICASDDVTVTASLHVDSYPDPNEPGPTLAETGSTTWLLAIAVLAVACGAGLLFAGSAPASGRHR